MSFLDCINHQHSLNESDVKAEKIQNAIAATCSKCHKNPLMKGQRCKTPKSDCLIVHQELEKKGLK